MATVISNTNLETHNVNPYNFKVLSLNTRDETEEDSVKKKYTPESNPRARVSDVDSSALSNSSKESLIESLMQKTDEMSSNFIKLQMKLESKEQEFEVALEQAKERAFVEGKEAGRVEAQKEAQLSQDKSSNLFASSIVKLEESANEFESALEGIKKELILAALDISKEVIKVELNENSNEVAKILSSELLKDLQSASKVVLKVNPNNHGAISEQVGNLEHIKIMSDSAVSEGGVIVMSDAGNVDAQISKRFERVKRAALSE